MYRQAKIFITHNFISSKLYGSYIEMKEFSFSGKKVEN